MDKTEGKIILPRDFEKRMQGLLLEEYADFLAAYEKERSYGLRFNPLKAKREEFLKRMPFSLEAVAWTDEGFYYRPEDCPGRYALHEAGAYYIQEPSAMAVVEVLSPEPGERILDLCAAPGGKSTQIAGKLRGEGLLVSNEIIPGRAKVLSQNIERMGIPNAVVCNETPERLAEWFPAFFDKILVDAPCSGEGMFRKDETAVSEWALSQVQVCADRQRRILEQAALMLRPGGVLVYSTCTFSAEENEGVISDFLHAHTEFSIEEAKQERFFATGRKEWIENPAAGIEHTMRLWPHKIAGEGHFIAKLGKADGLYAKAALTIASEMPGGKGKEKGRTDNIQVCRDFLLEEIGLSEREWEKFSENGVYSLFGEHMYLTPKQMIPLGGIKTLRPGLHLGVHKKNRFEPSHALALYLSPDAVRAHYEVTLPQAECYLRGETLACDDALKGWVLLTLDGYAVGFGKAGGGQIKNHYPKGLRKQ